MHANEIELVLSKNNVYPISGNELFELLKSLGECKGMFKEEKTCFFGNFFVGLFPFEKNSQGAIDYSTGYVYFDGCHKLWINANKILKNSDELGKLSIHVIRLLAAQISNFKPSNEFYNELKERQDKVAFTLIIRNKDVPFDFFKELLYYVEGDNALFNLFVDAMLERAIENSVELNLVRDVSGLKRRILGKLVGK